ncbi:4Fe-4S binding protein [Paenibacillus thermoaerophilus]|jgi:NAD-dependent dihydropyrimidine dehydrogenase PreA subunit|uniref:4Fe-4S binding protein n=1 Tax=Paenibacillus thermoaerophilus TaxID=1215385 RepID=A0ABW2V9G8_9BACL|nr:ferredoxin family protein [Paenibacillus thermoaerophilus]TMV07304.1 ferredoxin family protein [Paenibacillus thermoaerophilus]
MIEILSESKCIRCNLCVSVCPTDVFERKTGGVPVIARQSDCQTCFMCELYCPVDALYVAPDPEPNATVTEREVEEHGLIGGYRERVGWGAGRTPVAKHPAMYELSVRTRIG